MTSSEICFVPANLPAGMIRDRDVSVREVMEAHLARIEEVNSKANAIITLIPDEALRQARLADEALARGEDPGPLFGLPIPHKDLTLTKGIRTTFGSPISINDRAGCFRAPWEGTSKEQESPGAEI